jgi:hypothetical protein
MDKIGEQLAKPNLPKGALIESVQYWLDQEAQGMPRSSFSAYAQQLLDAFEWDAIRQSLQDKVKNGVGAGLRSGLQAALQTGDIGNFTKALAQTLSSSMSEAITDYVMTGLSKLWKDFGKTLVKGLADAMAEFASTSIVFAKMMEAVKKFLAFGNGFGAILAATALLAFANANGGKATMGNTSVAGGAGGLMTGMSAGSLPTQQIIFGATSATTAAGMTPRSLTNITVIGPNDPSAQRAIQELMNKANSRGSLG